MNKKELKEKIRKVLEGDNVVEYFATVSAAEHESSDGDVNGVKFTIPMSMNGNEITVDAFIVMAIQKQPNTVVGVTVVALDYRGNVVGRATGVGFSKVCWPDQWDFRIGFQRALGKAIGNATRKILGE